MATFFLKKEHTADVWSKCMLSRLSHASPHTNTQCDKTTKDELPDEWNIQIKTHGCIGTIVNWLKNKTRFMERYMTTAESLIVV